jgi:hypothetical protein
VTGPLAVGLPFPGKVTARWAADGGDDEQPRRS